MGWLHIYLHENHQDHPVIVGKHAVRPIDGYRMRLPSMSRALLQQSVYRMVSDGEPLVGGGTGRRYDGGSVSASIRRLRMTEKQEKPVGNLLKPFGQWKKGP